MSARPPFADTIREQRFARTHTCNDHDPRWNKQDQPTMPFTDPFLFQSHIEAPIEPDMTEAELEEVKKIMDLIAEEAKETHEGRAAPSSCPAADF
jgi:hypothetical protein